jgi:hypothetical protein
MVNESEVVIRESAVTSAPFFESAGRQSQPFWGSHQGNKLVLWESLSEEEKVKYWKILQQKKDGPNGVGITRERLTKGHKSLRSMSSGSSDLHG